MSIHSWVVPVPGHGEVTVRLVLRSGDEMIFVWHPAGADPSGLPSHRKPPLLRRWVEAPSATCWWCENPSGWRPDPHRRLDEVGEAVRAFVDALPADELLAICRRHAAARLEEAVQRAAEERNALRQVVPATRWVRSRELEVAALAIDDPAARRAALRMMLAWCGSPGNLARAAHETVRGNAPATIDGTVRAG